MNQDRKDEATTAASEEMLEMEELIRAEDRNRAKKDRAGSSGRGKTDE